MTLSIRATLTAWYVGVLAVVTMSFAGASWWLSTQSVLRATDTSLQARVEGVRAFLQNPHTTLTIESLRDEFGEYAELTRGEALLEVIDESGTVLCRPSIPGWSDLATLVSSTSSPGAVRPEDRAIGNFPFRVASAELVAHGRAYHVTVAAPMKPAYEALNHFHRVLLWLLPLVIALAGAGGYLVSRRALAPVDQVTRTVEAITVQSLDRRLAVPPAHDELRRLATTFNGVLARLEVAVADIVRFTADASHELRTPVSLIRTTAELALRHERGAEDYRKALSDIGSHARHMSELVNDLLVLARIDAGIEPRGTICVEVAKAAADASTDLRELAARRSVRIATSLPRQSVYVHGDEMSLKRLLHILLENAVKYSEPTGQVRLQVTLQTTGEGGSVAIVVGDDGIGLDASDEARAFERFYRGSRARQHAPEGTGLGLAIASSIVQRYRGTISIGAADGVDRRGCRVRVIFPLADDRESATAMPA